MRFATFANVVLNYILLQSSILMALQYWTVFNIEGIIFYFKKKIYVIFVWSARNFRKKAVKSTMF